MSGLDIPMTPVQSSNVAAVGYDATTETLAVSFKGGGIYHYEAVPADVHAALMAAPSAGKYLAEVVKPRFACAKQEPAAVANPAKTTGRESWPHEPGNVICPCLACMPPLKIGPEWEKQGSDQGPARPLPAIVEEARSLRAAITPGTWLPGKTSDSIVTNDPVTSAKFGATDEGADCIAYYGGVPVAETIGGADRAFVCAAPRLVDQLVAELEAYHDALIDAREGGAA